MGEFFQSPVWFFFFLFIFISLLIFFRKKPRLKPILSRGVMDRIQIDLKEFTLYADDNDGYNYLLTVVDHFSGFPWAFPLFNKTANEVAHYLINLFFEYGPPRYEIEVDVILFPQFLGFFIQTMEKNL